MIANVGEMIRAGHTREYAVSSVFGVQALKAVYPA